MTYWWNEIGDRISLFNLAIWYFALVFFFLSLRWRKKKTKGLGEEVIS